MSTSHQHNLAAYPVTLGDAPMLVVQKLRGEAVEGSCLRHAAWHVAGFGLGQLDPDERPMATAGATMSEAELITELEALEKPQTVAEMRAIPWADILRTLLPLILRWLAVVLLLVLLAPQAQAASQAPIPPQSLLAVREAPTPTPRPDKGWHCPDWCCCGCQSGRPCTCEELNRRRAVIVTPPVVIRHAAPVMIHRPAPVLAPAPVFPAPLSVRPASFLPACSPAPVPVSWQPVPAFVGGRGRAASC